MHIMGPQTVKSKKEDKPMARQSEGKMCGDLAGEEDIQDASCGGDMKIDNADGGNRGC